MYVETIGFDPHSKEKTQLSRLKINFRRVAHGARGQRACAHVHRAQSLSTCRAASGPSLHPDLVLVLLQGHTVSVTAVFWHIVLPDKVCPSSLCLLFKVVLALCFPNNYWNIVHTSQNACRDLWNFTRFIDALGNADIFKMLFSLSINKAYPSIIPNVLLCLSV